jgi:polar amino acid transport system permease protein
LLLSAASTLVLGGLLAVAVTRSPGWPRVRESFFDLRIGRDSLSSIADGMLLNLKVSAVCGVLILVFGLGVAVLRTLPGPVFWPVRAAATAYVDLFRGLPLILVLLLVGFGVPGLRLQGLPGDVVFYGGAALVLTYTAYVAEVFRAGIESIHPSQSAAARSLGLSAGQTMRYVVLPQAVRRVVPALLNDLISLQKDSGLVSVLGAIDAVAAAQIATAKTFNFTPYVVAGGLFVLITVPQTRLTDWLTRRWWS